ncbi:putative receptor-like protein 8 [Ziziphus jujuba]|uniref:Receptor-like protein 8 n=1 Tax=Ziziphus jujuba TaxID=326968 RepID=A0ABM4AGP2_ZIZJJ|nr:putative receptor-like protein 8 [Ziziphus jujuba]
MLLCGLDLSSNKLTGDIPQQLPTLQGLQFVNLSGNFLKGSIPNNISNMKSLESVRVGDLIRKARGRIPPGISSLTYLSSLDLSYNNLSRKIPSNTQLQSFDASSFIGNELCGPPLPMNCEGDQIVPTAENGGQKEGD